MSEEVKARHGGTTFVDGMRRALWLVNYHRGIPGGTPHAAYIGALDRVQNSIEAELENGGPLTTPVETFGRAPADTVVGPPDCTCSAQAIAAFELDPDCAYHGRRP